jgi:hypothetical protein
LRNATWTPITEGVSRSRKPFRAGSESKGLKVEAFSLTAYDHLTNDIRAGFPRKNVLSSRSPAATDDLALDGVPNGITLDTPLRLADAVRFGFPAGGMTVSGLRREINRGRLDVELIAGKQFTTLANIERMREKCRAVAKAPDCGSDRRGGKAGAQSPPRFGSSRTPAGISPQDALRAQLKQSRLKKPSKR